MEKKHAKLISWAYLYALSLVCLCFYAHEVISVHDALNLRVNEISLSEQNFLLLLAAGLPIGHLCSKLPINSSVDRQKKLQIKVGVSIFLLVIVLLAGFLVQREYKNGIILAGYVECQSERYIGLRSAIKTFKNSELLCK
jgi:hypothetical protein